VAAKTIYFVAGEVSGDNHGAALLRSLRETRSDLRFVGRGGPRMKEAAGEDFQDWVDEAAVLGLWEVLKNYGYFRRTFHETLRDIERYRPDAVVLIDYPGFNLRLARALKGKGLGPKIIYYISPQVWAWNRGRIKQMAKWLDLMLCIFPFEAELYNKSGLRTIFVGHPMLERLDAQKLDGSRDPKLVALFPGSRRREIRKIFPVMLETVKRLLRSHPELRFQVAAASPELEDLRARTFGSEAPLEVRVGEASTIMQRAGVAIIASGSATLEAAFFRLPFVLIYKVAWLTYLAGRLVVRIKYLGMPNVLANSAVVPEFIQHKAKPDLLAPAVRRLIEDSVARGEMIRNFDQIIDSLGAGGASLRAAKAVVAGCYSGGPKKLVSSNRLVLKPTLVRGASGERRRLACWRWRPPPSRTLVGAPLPLSLGLKIVAASRRNQQASRLRSPEDIARTDDLLLVTSIGIATHDGSLPAR
jgi:lipid-A-disaccharide synthase